ncbi:uncharacterized protein HQ_1211A [Haloquadratum walsbyi DSM 16790]|uniref:Uncharacterized protein n=2 Tax=Haloquadratum walsbyi TaxID=293091 RepID=Q18KV2_HALWD|nr:uncharacterized protein HQ_1211A [Haloquadratum walsbyi DSM 16790]
MQLLIAVGNGRAERVKLSCLYYNGMNIQYRLLLITLLLLTVVTGVAVAQFGGGGGGGGGSNLITIIENIIQFLQSITDIFSA